MANKTLSGFGIAITRPIDQAKKLTERIENAGGTAISFPMIAIASLSDYATFNQTITTLDQYDWAIFISSNAVQNGLPRVKDLWPGLPTSLSFAAIGPVTANELNAFGVKKVLTPQERFDSESLLALPEMQAMQGKKVMIFRGVGGREILAETLKSRGAEVVFAECYQRVNPQKSCQKLQVLWQKQQCHAIVVTSSEAMQHLLAMAFADQDAMANQDIWIRHVQICVNHARIAEQAQSFGLKMSVAASPGDEAMFACIEKALNPS
jgi:uroporphyrinogen-III synthase